MKNSWQLSCSIIFTLLCLVSCETMQERCAKKNLDLEQKASMLKTQHEANYTHCFSSRKSDLAPPKKNNITLFEL